MRVWDALYFSPGEFKPDPQKPADWNRGAFLVEGPGHCTACHTPKSFLGGDKSGEYLRGSYLQGWFAPDITNDDRVGLGRWSADDIVAYLKTGHNRITAATGPMAEEIEHSTSKLKDEDLAAMAAYLKSRAGFGGQSRAIESRRSGDGRGAGDLPRSMRGVPSDRRQGRAAVVPVARGIVRRALA